MHRVLYLLLALAVLPIIAGCGSLKKLFLSEEFEGQILVQKPNPFQHTNKELPWLEIKAYQPYDARRWPEKLNAKIVAKAMNEMYRLIREDYEWRYTPLQSGGTRDGNYLWEDSERYVPAISKEIEALRERLITSGEGLSIKCGWSLSKVSGLQFGDAWAGRSDGGLQVQVYMTSITTIIGYFDSKGRLLKFEGDGNWSHFKRK